MTRSKPVTSEALAALLEGLAKDLRQGGTTCHMAEDKPLFEWENTRIVTAAFSTAKDARIHFSMMYLENPQ